MLGSAAQIILDSQMAAPFDKILAFDLQKHAENEYDLLVAVSLGTSSKQYVWRYTLTLTSGLIVTE